MESQQAGQCKYALVFMRVLKKTTILTTMVYDVWDAFNRCSCLKLWGPYHSLRFGSCHASGVRLSSILGKSRLTASSQEEQVSVSMSHIWE